LDVHYPDALYVRLVLDNLNTHTGASLYEAFQPLSRRFEPGTVLIVELSSAKAEGRQLIRVVHATREKKKGWIIGCAFVTPLSEEELQTFLRE
jgi:hypothetical protein